MIYGDLDTSSTRCINIPHIMDVSRSREDARVSEAAAYMNHQNCTTRLLMASSLPAEASNGTTGTSTDYPLKSGLIQRSFGIFHPFISNLPCSYLILEHIHLQMTPTCLCNTERKWLQVSLCGMEMDRTAFLWIGLVYR